MKIEWINLWKYYIFNKYVWGFQLISVSFDCVLGKKTFEFILLNVGLRIINISKGDSNDPK
jgi:hypothetical protein